MGIVNNIRIKSNIVDRIEKRDIENALNRNLSISSNHIRVNVIEHAVTLTGDVKSWFEKDEAARIAWKAPGVWTVDNELAVEYV